MDYITAVANLKAQMFGIPSNRDASYIKKLAMSIDVPVFTPRSGVKIEVNDSELGNNSGETSSKWLKVVCGWSYEYSKQSEKSFFSSSLSSYH